MFSSNLGTSFLTQGRLNTIQRVKPTCFGLRSCKSIGNSCCTCSKILHYGDQSWNTHVNFLLWILSQSNNTWVYYNIINLVCIKNLSQLNDGLKTWKYGNGEWTQSSFHYPLNTWRKNGWFIMIHPSFSFKAKFNWYYHSLILG